MRFDLATASKARADRRLQGWVAAGALFGLVVCMAVGMPGCSRNKTSSASGGGSSGSAGAGKQTGPEKTILATRQGESSIQVTESEIDGSQVVRINTRYRGEDHSIVLNIDQPVYDIEIPLTLEQIAPGAAGTASAGASTPAGQFQDLLIAQYIEKAQEAMLNGDYQGALRQVNLVLLTRPEHPQAHTMKGSIYYAMGNYALANDEWEKVLQLDPSNQEVRQFLDFLKSRKGAPQPPLPGAPKGAPQPNAPQAPRAGGTQGNNPGSQAPGQR